MWPCRCCMCVPRARSPCRYAMIAIVHFRQRNNADHTYSERLHRLLLPQIVGCCDWELIRSGAGVSDVVGDGHHTVHQRPILNTTREHCAHRCASGIGSPVLHMHRRHCIVTDHALTRRHMRRARHRHQSSPLDHHTHIVVQVSSTRYRTTITVHRKTRTCCRAQTTINCR
jgi:hypothetical protein